MDRRRMWSRPVLIAACGVAVLGGAGYGAHHLLADGLPDSVPQCSWPLKAAGPASGEQVGLVRCYVKAVARRDLPALRSLAVPGAGLTVSGSQLAHSADARSGTATAAFVPNPEDSAYVNVTITYADSTRERVAIELANPASLHSWRIAIGSDNSTASFTPPAPAQP